MSRFSKQIFTIIIFSLIFISCGGNSTSEVVEIQETTTTLTTTTSTSTTTTTLTTTTSTLPDIMPTVLINCEPVESFTMAEGYMNFNFEITTGTNELVVLNIVSWFDSSRTDDLFIYDGLPSPGSSNEFGYRVDDNFSQYEIEIVVMDSKDNFATRVKELTDGKGVPIVYDGVGKDTLEGSLECLKMRGMMVSFGNASGPLSDINVPKMLQPKGLFFVRPSMQQYLSTKEELDEAASIMFEKIKSGKVKIEIFKKYKLEDVIQAHKDLESRKIIGPAVIIP